MARNPKKASRPLAGQVVLITGGARGIGEALGRAMAHRGCKVAIGDLDGERAAEVASSLGTGCFGTELDVTDRVSFEAFAEATTDRLGEPDVFVNNAGVMLLGDLENEADTATDAMIDVNVRGLILGTKIAMRQMIPRGSGTIVNIASQAGKTGFPGAVTYSATKHAVVGLCEAARAELRGTGVGVTCVMPAIVATELGSGLSKVTGVPTLEPTDLAEAIVEAVQTGRYEVWAPRFLRALVTGTGLVPRPISEAIGRQMGIDRILAEADMTERQAYERRAGESTSRLR